MAIPYGKPIEDKALRSNKVRSPAKGSKMAKSRASATTTTSAEAEENCQPYSGRGTQPKGSSAKSARNKSGRAAKERNLKGDVEF